MQVTINQVKPGKDGWTTFEGSGEVFTLPPDKGTVAKGGVYEVAFREKETQWGKKKYVTMLKQLQATPFPPPAVVAPTPATNGNGKHSEARETNMAKLGALKASVEMAKIEFEKNPTIDIGTTQEQYYFKFLGELTK